MNRAVLAHWGLSSAPFTGAGGHFFVGETQGESLARLRYAGGGALSALVSGSRGIGKSTLVGEFARERRASGSPTAVVALRGLSSTEFLWQAAGGFRLGPQPGEDAARLFRRIAEWASTHDAAPTPVLLLDDLHLAEAEVRSQAERLLRLAPAGRLAVAATVGADGPAWLGDDLRDLFDLRIELEPWSESESARFVEQSLAAAGSKRALWSDDACEALHALTGGVPRRVKRLADHALLAGAAAGLSQVDGATVEAAHEAATCAA